MTEGLRERKRRMARHAMEDAAVGIAYDEGVAAVTVDRVCEAAMVSRSTFFNYFASLDQAIFGSPLQYDPELTQRVLAEHSDDLVTAACVIVMESVLGDPDDEITRRRYALFVREPGTTAAVSWAAHESRENLVEVIRAWLDEHPDHARLADADHATEARLVVGQSIALGDEVQRHAREVDGRVVIAPDVFPTARRRMATIAAVLG